MVDETVGSKGAKGVFLNMQTASIVAATSSASQKQISVQVEGKCRVRAIYDSAGTYQTAIVPGERVQIAEDSPSSYDGQVVAHAVDNSGSDPNSDAMCIGIALTGLSSTATTPQNIDILLQPRSS